MMVKSRDRVDISDRGRELRQDSAAAKAASLAGWLIVAALMLTLVAAD